MTAIFLERDQGHALLAVVAAVAAGARDEIPVGALLIDSVGRIIADAGNSPIADHDPVGHAEIVALRRGGLRMANYRLASLHMVVSLRPCPLCVEALKISRISEVLYLSEAPESTLEIGRTVSIEKMVVADQKAGSLALIKRASSEILRFFFARRRGI
ncbi:MAG: nucleoside deaminase [Magnetococcales bacterium]|nr:nucleoside deaminase [Magnetococcales bacterium]